jgi:hypothetical protein
MWLQCGMHQQTDAVPSSTVQYALPAACRRNYIMHTHTVLQAKPTTVHAALPAQPLPACAPRRRNYIMNKQNGLVIRPFKKAHLTRHTDKELLHLTTYLSKIAPLPSLAHLSHRHWEEYVTGRRSVQPKK